MINHRPKRKSTKEFNSCPITQTEHCKPEMNPPSRKALLLESSLESPSRPPPPAAAAAAAAANTVIHVNKRQSHARPNEQSKSSNHGNATNQTKPTNQYFPTGAEHTNPNVKDLTVPLPNGCRKSTPNQPHMANLKLPCGTRTQAAQQPEPISSKAPVKVSALSLFRELQGI
ncbi:hypothetical protein B9Z19DRAFT_1110910 [Tuber borchii]|uniref:Uncharacterized protein n=1 Tax=Tuber borchii TaxID=42251 RepID=A0A2T6ZEV4_TUBBO|nr:hypothetical protein B9Z19DRAFT_1110910 [Tuber borchii]